MPHILRVQNGSKGRICSTMFHRAIHSHYLSHFKGWDWSIPLSSNHHLLGLPCFSVPSSMTVFINVILHPINTLTNGNFPFLNHIYNVSGQLRVCLMSLFFTISIHPSILSQLFSRSPSFQKCLTSWCLKISIDEFKSHRHIEILTADTYRRLGV